MVNGKYNTGSFKVFNGPALITYVYCYEGTRVGSYEHGSVRTKLSAGPGLYLPRGASITLEQESIISYVVPQEAGGS